MRREGEIGEEKARVEEIKTERGREGWRGWEKEEMDRDE